MTAIQEAEQAGFDLGLVDESLGCSPEQRALQHQMALELALKLEKRGQQLRDRIECGSSVRDAACACWKGMTRLWP
jgi:hypothetical protein